MNIRDFTSADQIREWLLADKCIDLSAHRGHVATLTDVLDSVRDADRHRIDRAIIADPCHGGMLLKAHIESKAHAYAVELYEDYLAEEDAA
jgi:hypothetical protein